MSREKQIDKDELQQFIIALSDCQHKYDKEVNKAIITKSPLPKENKFYAKYLMEQGYRKQSEVAREIFEEIDSELGGTIKRFPFCNRRYAELKKKYMEGEDEQRVGV